MVIRTIDRYGFCLVCVYVRTVSIVLFNIYIYIYNIVHCLS